MNCSERFRKQRAGEVTRVDPAEVDGRAICVHPGCGQRLRGDGTCVRGHDQGRHLFPAEMPAIFCALEEWARLHPPRIGSAGWEMVTNLQGYKRDLEYAREGRTGGAIWDRDYGLDGERDFYQLGAQRLREAVEFLEEQGVDWQDDPRVQVARDFVEANRQVRAGQMQDILDMDNRTAQTAVLRELVEKAHAVDVADLVGALVERRRSGSLIRRLRERYPEVTMEELLGAAHFLARESQPLDTATLGEIVPHLTDTARRYLLHASGYLAADRYGALVAVVAPHMEQPVVMLQEIASYAPASASAEQKAEGRARALAALAPRLEAAQIPTALTILEESVGTTSRVGGEAVRQCLAEIAMRVPSALVYRAVDVAQMVGADPTAAERAVRSIQPLITRGDSTEELLFAVQQNSRANPYFRRYLLQALFVHLREEEQWRRVFDTVDSLAIPAIWGDVANAVPPSMMGELLARLATTKMDEDTRLDVFHELAPRCPAAHWSEFMAQAATLRARAAGPDGEQTVMHILASTPPEGWPDTLQAVAQMPTLQGRRMRLLTQVVQWLPDEYVAAAVDTVLGHADNVEAAQQVFAQLGPRLSSEQAAQAVRTAWQAHEELQAQDQARSHGGYTPPRSYYDSARGNVLAHAVLTPAVAAKLPPEAMADAVALLGYTPHDRYDHSLLAMLPRMPATVLPQAAGRAHLHDFLERRYYANDADFALAQQVRDAVLARARELGVELE